MAAARGTDPGVALSIGGIVAVLVVWELVSLFMAQSAVVPSPWAAANSLVSMLRTGSFWSRFDVSAEALAAGFGIVVGAGIPLGILAGFSPVADKALDPYVSFLLSAPLAPLVPVLIAAVGLGIWSTILEVIAFAMPILIVNTIDGVRQAPASLLEMATSFQASRRQVLWHVRLPNALPSVMAGLRLAVGRAVIGMIVAELIVANTGLGGLINNFGSTFNGPGLYATVIIVVIMGMVLVRLLGSVDKRVVRWRS